MVAINCVLNEQLRPAMIDHTEDTNFYTAIYEDMSDQPLLESIKGVALLAKGDEEFYFESDGTIHVRNIGDRRKIIGGNLFGKTLSLRWVGKPDMVFVSYLIAKPQERHKFNWLKEGF